MGTSGEVSEGGRRGAGQGVEEMSPVVGLGVTLRGWAGWTGGQGGDAAERTGYCLQYLT